MSHDETTVGKITQLTQPQHSSEGEVPILLDSPLESATMSWNGHMTKYFNDRMLKLERTVQMNSDRICAIETRHMTEDNCEQAKIQD